MNAQELFDFLESKSQNGTYLEKVQLFSDSVCFDKFKWVESPGDEPYIEFSGALVLKPKRRTNSDNEVKVY